MGPPGPNHGEGHRPYDRVLKKTEVNYWCPLFCRGEKEGHRKDLKSYY